MREQVWLCILLALHSSAAQRTRVISVNNRGNANNGDQTNLKLGLVSDVLGVDPLGGSGSQGGSSGNLQEGRTPRHCCCVSRGQRCPIEGDDFDFDDYDGIGTRIVNNPQRDEFVACPAGSTRCCYSSKAFLDSLRGSCFVPGSGTGEPWRQLCQERIPAGGSGRKQCGQRNFRHVPNLLRGEASPEEFPWTCLVLDGANNFVGTCAIIPENSNNDISRGTTKVITAAHKLKSVGTNDLLKVRVLEYDASEFSSPERERHQEYTVVRITEHPEYRDRRFINDVTILTLEKPINLLRHDGINAACIPTCDNMFGYQFSNGTGTRCWVAGWGRDRQNGNFQAVMHKVDVPLYDDDKCEAALRRALERENNLQRPSQLRLHPSEICAGGETGKDACDGDGGAPLVCQSLTGRWYVVGLVTWGVNCAQTDVPGVYARISYFRNWIDRN